MIEFFTRFDNTAMWTLDLRRLRPDWVSRRETYDQMGRANGKANRGGGGRPKPPRPAHDLTAIALDKSLHADFADGYMTIQHGPYKVRLDGFGGARPATALSLRLDLLPYPHQEL